MNTLDVVRLVKEFNGLSAGTEGSIVLDYDGTAYELEFFDSAGETIDVLTTPVDLIELVALHKSQQQHKSRQHTLSAF